MARTRPRRKLLDFHAPEELDQSLPIFGLDPCRGIRFCGVGREAVLGNGRDHAAIRKVDHGEGGTFLADWRSRGKEENDQSLEPGPEARCDRVHSVLSRDHRRPGEIQKSGIAARRSRLHRRDSRRGIQIHPDDGRVREVQSNEASAESRRFAKGIAVFNDDVRVIRHGDSTETECELDFTDPRVLGFAGFRGHRKLM